MTSLLAVTAAYLIGSISFAMVASRIFRLPDPHTYGSGNPGAANVLRSGKKTAAAVTLLGDTAKGFVVVMLVRHLAPTLDIGEWTVAACALAVFLGHLYPIYFGFKGGKGVSTALGVLFGLSVTVALLSLSAFVAVAVLLRYVSLASMSAAVVAAATSVWLMGLGPSSAAVWLLTAMIIWRHRNNVYRLFSGTENKLKWGPRDTPPAGPAV